jgi:Flp pilus assembly secretin CpaC
MSFRMDVPTNRDAGRPAANPGRAFWNGALLLGILGVPVFGQQVPPGRPAGSAADEARKIVSFKGSVLKQPAQQLCLTVNQSILVKTEEPCEGVESQPPGIIWAEQVSEREVLVRGRSAGEAELRLYMADRKTPIFRADVKVTPALGSKPAEEPPRKELFHAVARVEPVQRFRMGINKSMLIKTSMPCRKVMTWYQPAEKEKGAEQAGPAKVEVRTGAGGAAPQEKEKDKGKGKSDVIITAETISPREVLVIGTSCGVTQLLLITEDDQCQVVEITVEVEVERLNEVLRTMFPQAQVKADAVLDTIILEGQVSDLNTARRIQDIAEAFSPEVRNHIRVVDERGRAEQEIALELLNQAIKQTAPTAKVRARWVLGTIFLEGQVPDAETSERIMEVAEIFSRDQGVSKAGRQTSGADAKGAGGAKGAKAGAAQRAEVKNHMQVAGVQQVLLRCTVAEVSKTALRQLGFNGWMAGDNVRDMFVVNQLSGINPSNIGAAADALVAPTVIGTTPPRVPFLTGNQGIPLQPTVPLSIGFPRVQMQFFINALRENDLLRILAEPNLLAISGQTATFRVGGEYAYPIPTFGGVPSVDFKPFGIQLTFAPVVLADQRIKMRIMPEVSEPDDTIGTVIQGTAVPGLAERRLETVVEIGNGQTLALAGLLNETVRASTQKIPGLGDIPVVGALFSSVRYQRQTIELLVLCTPELVSPMNPDQVPPVPGQEMTPPNDWQLFGLGQYEGEKRPVPNDAQRALETTAPVKTYKNAGGPPEPAAALPLQGPWGVAMGEEGR